MHTRAASAHRSETAATARRDQRPHMQPRRSPRPRCRSPRVWQRAPASPREPLKCWYSSARRAPCWLLLYWADVGGVLPRRLSALPRRHARGHWPSRRSGRRRAVRKHLLDRDGRHPHLPRRGPLSQPLMAQTCGDLTAFAACGRCGDGTAAAFAPSPMGWRSKGTRWPSASSWRRRLWTVAPMATLCLRTAHSAWTGSRTFRGRSSSPRWSRHSGISRRLAAPRSA